MWDMNARFHFMEDMNYDGVTTISDVQLWLEWLFFLPGDGLIWWLAHSPRIVSFWEISAGSYMGIASGVLSILFFWGPAYLIFTCYSPQK